MKPTVGRLLDVARFSLAPRSGEDVLRQGLIIMNLEKAMGMFWEPWVQGRVSAFPPLMDFLVWSYGALHLPLIMGAMIWIFTQRRSSWPQFRNWFLAMNFMAVLLYFLLPTAPPRMIFTS